MQFPRRSMRTGRKSPAKCSGLSVPGKTPNEWVSKSMEH